MMHIFGELYIDPYVTTLVMFSAWTVIGTRGIVYGPLLLLLVIVTAKFFKPQNEDEVHTPPRKHKKKLRWGAHVKTE